MATSDSEKDVSRRITRNLWATAQLGKAAATVLGWGAAIGALTVLYGALLTKAYFRELGTQWALPLISPADYFAAGLPSFLHILITTTGILFAASVNAKAAGIVDRLSYASRLVAVCVLFAAIAMWLLASAPVFDVFSRAAGLLLKVCAGLWLSDLIVKIAERPDRFSHLHFYPFYALGVYALLVAPMLEGFGAGKLNSDARYSRLSHVILSGGEGSAPWRTGWRLVASTADGLLVVRFDDDGALMGSRVVADAEVVIVVAKE